MTSPFITAKRLQEISISSQKKLEGTRMGGVPSTAFSRTSALNTVVGSSAQDLSSNLLEGKIHQLPKIVGEIAPAAFKLVRPLPSNPLEL